MAIVAIIPLPPHTRGLDEEGPLGVGGSCCRLASAVSMALCIVWVYE